MPRAHARILCSILEDEDFQELSPLAQRLYFILLAQPLLTTAGVLPLTLKRWARACKATTVADISDALTELNERRYVLVDEDTEECLIRSFIRNDGVSKQPQMLSNALRVAHDLVSPKLKSILANELRKLDREDADRVADALSPRPDGPPPPRPTGSSNTLKVSPIQANGSLPPGSEQSTASVSPTRGGRGKGVGSPSVDQNLSSKTKSKSCAIESIKIEDELDELKLSPKDAKPSLTSRFKEFYAAYPRRVAPRAAEKAWVAALKRGIDPQLLIDAAERLAISCRGRDNRFTKHPSTWLNGDCYLDEPEIPNLWLVPGDAARRDPQSGRIIESWG